MASERHGSIIVKDDEEFDRAGLIRLGAWGAGAVIALAMAVWAGASELAAKRADVAPPAAAAPSNELLTSVEEIEHRATEVERDVRQISDALRILMTDRDRMTLRLGMIERNLGDITGSIARDRMAATESKGFSASKAPSDVKPPAEAAAPAEAKTPEAKPAAEPKAQAETKTTPVAKPAASEAAANPPALAESTEAVKPAAKPQTVAALTPLPPVKPGAIPAQSAAVSPPSSAATPAMQPPSATPPPAAAAAPVPATPVAAAPSPASATPGPTAAPAEAPKPTQAEAAKPEPAAPASATAAPPAPSAAGEGPPAASVVAALPAPAPAPTATPAVTSSGSTAVAPENGVDLGSALSINRLRSRWTSLKTVYGTLFEGLRPVVAIRENNKGWPLEMHLIVGPFPTPAAATKFCATIVRTQYSCQPAPFDGQRLAVR